MKTRLLWTALPRAVSATELHLSIFVAPQLDTSPQATATVNDFPVIRDWPSQALTLQIRFNNSPPSAVTVGPKHAQALAMWQAMFPPALTVDGFKAQSYAGERLHSYPVANVVDFVRRHYSRIGVMSPTEVPTLAALKALGFDQIATVAAQQREYFDITDRRKAALDQLFQAHGGLVIPPLAPDPPMDFFRAVFFHTFKGGNRSVPVPKPTFDFHRGFSMLLDHPDLLRAVGIVIDVRLPLAGQPAAGVVRVVPTHAFASEDVTPATKYALDTGAGRFLAAPSAGSPLLNGLLNVAGTGFDLVQVDADGTALKSVEFANQVVLREGGRLKSADSTDDAALPALRTGGLALVQTGRGAALHTRFGQLQSLITTLNNQLPLPDLTADDLVTGFRIDIEDKGAWRSICRRHANYHFVHTNAQVAFDGEASVGATLMRDEHGAKPENYLHEALFHWDGWSLAAPRLGDAIQEPTAADPAPHTERLDNKSETELGLEITSNVIDGSLPRIRFGRTYRLRVRAADIAGNSISHQSNDAAAASAAQVYRRFEPLEPPAIVLLSKEPLDNLPGESAYRLVVRSRNGDESLDGVVSPEVSERVIMPPRTSVTMIEQAGALDLADGTIDSSPTTWERIATKDETLAPEIAAAPIAEVPYLPDPFAVGVVFRRLPGAAPASSLPLAFDATTWWNHKPLTLALVEGTAGPDWDPVGRTLTVALPKGTTRKIRVSSQLEPNTLGKMALWEWFESEAFDDDDVKRLKAVALDGAHWMLTPPREITLVHAVIQPLARPVITTLKPLKSSPGQTFADLQGSVDVHGPSTGRIDLVATWNELTGIGFATNPAGGHVCDLRVNDENATAASLAGHRHDFADTKRRTVTYRATASTRFRDYFDPAETVDPAAVSRAGVDTFEAEVLSSGRPAAPMPLYAIPTFEWQRGVDDTGSFSRRLTGLRIYLEGTWFSSGEAELLGIVVLAFPADGCTPSRQPATQGALTILRTEPRTIAPSMKSYVSQWGRDPIWLSSGPQTLPSVANFPRAVAHGIALSLSEVSANKTLPDGSSARVAVAGHEIAWDADRHLFYADIDVDAGTSYYPFVRLALARYQPGSIPDVELSPVVLADFIQLAPERTASIVRHADQPGLLRLTLTGPAARASASFLCANRVDVRLERFLDASESNFGWVPASFSPDRLQAVQALKDVAVWTGELQLPADRPDARYRVIFEEYEELLADQVDPEPPPGVWGSGVAQRLVYADAVEI